MKSKAKMLQEVLLIRKRIGNTPVVKLAHPDYQLYAKLESTNFTGSIKDRAVNNILYHGILEDKINSKTTIVESSSGNFGMSAALHCRRLGLDFIAVVDPCINSISLKMLKLFATKVIMVEEPDGTGGYLLNRIKKVQELVQTIPNSYWTNQYQNPYNYKAYTRMADEIKNSTTSLDYLFVAVSSCGTITGLSKFVKDQFPEVTVVGVDIRGSMVFSSEKHKRYISGLGAGQKADFLDQASVDDSVILSHEEIITGCRELLSEHSIFAGGSSGACYYGAKKYLGNLGISDPSVNALLICPDGGTNYLDNIYDDTWAERIISEDKKKETVHI